MALLKAIAAVTITIALPTIPALADSNAAPIFVTNANTGIGLFFGHNAIARILDAVTPNIHRWEDFVAEASARFDIPAAWIRSVMQAESNGYAFIGGVPITSRAGAIGLMQVMPETYVELKQHYGLGDDPADPHDNILAGAAYLRELYERFGAPDFLAAYNAGPGRMDAYLAGKQPLPSETSRYLEKLGPSLATSLPSRAAPKLAALHDDNGQLAGGPLFFNVNGRRKSPLASP
jgi:soluble lytic murein transglycosylase-like protein